VWNHLIVNGVQNILRNWMSRLASVIAHIYWPWKSGWRWDFVTHCMFESEQFPNDVNRRID
jgi:hypothetical protein